MKKRAAMVIAAGLVAAMLAGTVAFTTGVIGPQAQAGSTTAALAPHVRTTHQTVTVHRTARTHAAPVIRTIAAPAQVSAPRSFGDDDGYEGEGGGDGGEGGFNDD